MNAPESIVHDHASLSKINSHEFNLPAIKFVIYQKKKCIKPMYKIKVARLPGSLRINISTLCYEQVRPIEEKGGTKNIFTQVKQFIMTNEKYITCFIDTKFDSKYLPIDESDITPKTNQMFSNKFPAMVLLSLLFQFYKWRIFQSVNIKCDLSS